MSGKERNTTFEFNNIHWELYRNTLMPAGPPHREISLSEEDCHELFHRTNAWLIRWPSQWDKNEISAFWYVIKDNYTGFGEFSRNTRSKVRRGLKNNLVRQIGKNELTKQGFSVYKKAFSRYHNSFRPLDRDKFLQRLDELDSDQYDFWGVYQNNDLVAYAEIRKIEDVINTSVLKFHPFYLKDYSGYALLYTLIEHYLGKRGIRYMTNGARSISHDTNVHNFLIEHFHFRRAYCKLNVCYRSILHHAVQLAYPFRSFTGKLPLKPFGKFYTLLAQEYIKRNS